MLEKGEKSMLFLLALAYWLLCVRLRVQIDVSLAGTKGNAVFSVGAFGVSIRREMRLAGNAQGMGFRFEPGKKSVKGKKNSAVQRKVWHLLALYLKRVVRKRRIERLMLHVRLGLEDACETAVAVGTLYASLCALAPSVVDLSVCDVRVTPDFAKPGFHACGQGIFFCQLGDIMLTALQTAPKKRKEGLKWTSIPLRA